MKNKPFHLLSTTTLALCGFMLLTPGGQAAEKDTLNSADVKFVKHEAAAGMAAVKMGELGGKKAARPEVKAFAEMMVAEHTKANAELKALAATKGVELSEVIQPKKAETYQKLEKTSGAEFDHEFLAAVVSSHTKCVSNLEEASTDASDGDVKAYANKMLPGLKKHLAKAKELSSNEVNSTGSTSTTKAADNTARNERDRDMKTLTPLDQGSSKSDTEITAQIRKGIIATKDMSVNAQNVKIITQNGKVTLRGPVNTAEEKTAIGNIAAGIAGAANVISQLEAK